MRMLTFFEELNLLKVFAKKDTQLSNRLEKAKTQKSEIVNEIQKCRENMDSKKTEIEAWQQKDKVIEGEFKALVPESNQFRPVLEKFIVEKLRGQGKKVMMKVMTMKIVITKVVRKKVVMMTMMTRMMMTMMIHAQWDVTKPFTTGSWK